MELQKVEEKNSSHYFSLLSVKKSFIFDGVKKGQGESKFFISLLSGRFGQRERSRTSVSND